MLEKVKSALRVKTNSFNSEIAGLIAACEADLQLAGIILPYGDDPNGCDPLIQRAVILYAKANFGFLEDAERYQKAYDFLKTSLSLAGDYR